jgi:hypothetical protein
MLGEYTSSLEMALYRLSTLVATLPLLHRTSALLAAQRRDGAEADHALRLSAAAALLLTVEALVPAPALLRRLVPLYAFVRLVVAVLLGRYATPDRLRRLQALCITTARKTKKVVRAIAAPISDDESLDQVPVNVLKPAEQRRQRRAATASATAAGSVAENDGMHGASAMLINTHVEDAVAADQQREYSEESDTDKTSGVRFAEAVAFVPEQDRSYVQSESDEELSMSIESTTSMSDLDTSSPTLDAQLRPVEERVRVEPSYEARPPLEGVDDGVRAFIAEAGSSPSSPAPARLVEGLPNSPVSEFNTVPRGITSREAPNLDALSIVYLPNGRECDEGEVPSNLSHRRIRDAVETSSESGQRNTQPNPMNPLGCRTTASETNLSLDTMHTSRSLASLSSPPAANSDIDGQDSKDSAVETQHVSNEDASGRVLGLRGLALTGNLDDGTSEAETRRTADKWAVKEKKPLQATSPKFINVEGSHIDVIQPVKARVSARFLKDADTLSVAEKARALDAWTETQPKFRDSAKVAADLPSRIPGVRSFHFSVPRSEATEAASSRELPSHLVPPSKGKVNASFVRDTTDGAKLRGSEQLSVLEKAKALQAYVDVQPKFRPGKEPVKY